MPGKLPLVSCLCPTYARPQLLRESVWCFLQQDYPNKEMIIVNDHADPIFLDREYPGVYVHNMPRFPKMGQVRNYSVQASRGEFLMLWDDDDLYLPWRVSEAVRHLQAAPEKWVFKPNRAWTSTHNTGYTVAVNLFHSQIAMRRNAFDQIGGYRDINVGEDADFEQRIPRERRIDWPVRPSELSYVYRWGNGICHISGLGEDAPGRPTAWETAEQINRDKKGGRVTPGFARDYWQDILTEASRLPEVDATELALLRRRLEPYLGSGAQS
ncbi:MAG TPA: glycosyltransferase family A protein [Symbiobacteriaceae bacterium]|nr:glycosyltransferase family A protein [Symbiobacteriaceae bacterium]